LFLVHMLYLSLFLALASLVTVLTGMFGNVRRRTKRRLGLIAVLNMLLAVAVAVSAQTHAQEPSVVDCLRAERC
jgi:hypothetical protein